MKGKSILADPTFWILIGINGYLVFRFYTQHDIFMTLLVLYWAQSMLLGVFTTLDILTLRKTKEEAAEETPANVVSGLLAYKKSTRLSGAKFFFLVFSGLHLFYLPFLMTMKNDKTPIQWEFFKYFFYVFLAGQVINFIQHKAQQWRNPENGRPNPFTPFIRVLPMHLTIIFASFFTGGAVGIFLILKSIADVVTYIATKPSENTRSTDAALVMSQQTQNLTGL